MQQIIVADLLKYVNTFGKTKEKKVTKSKQDIFIIKNK